MCLRDGRNNYFFDEIMYLSLQKSAPCPNAVAYRSWSFLNSNSNNIILLSHLLWLLKTPAISLSMLFLTLWDCSWFPFSILPCSCLPTCCWIYWLSWNLAQKGDLFLFSSQSRFPAAAEIYSLPFLLFFFQTLINFPQAFFWVHFEISVIFESKDFKREPQFLL